MFTLPKLPYQKNALEPVISEEAINYHYGKHHKTYIDNLNSLLEMSQFSHYREKSLENIILTSQGDTNVFNNSAQTWNHNFYWGCLKPNADLRPKGDLLKAIEERFSDFDSFKKLFSEIAISTFGSGWVWLVKSKTGRKLEIISTSNAQCPIAREDVPLLTCDVWEHAYYIDYRNSRLKYINGFFNIINWDFVSNQFTK